MLRSPSVIAVVLLSLTSVQSSPARSDDGSEPVAPLHVDAQLLYSTQLSFDVSGSPMVTVGLMDHQELVTVTSDLGMVIKFAGAAGGELRIPGGHALTMKVADARPGQTRFRVVLAGLRGGDLTGLARERSVWQKRSIAVAEIQLGGIVGFPRRVLDNRRSLLVEKAEYPTLAAARKRAALLQKKFGLDEPLRAFGQPVVRSTGTIVATDSLASITVRQAQMLRLQAVSSGTLEVKRVEFGRKYRHHGFADRRYRGELIVTLDRQARLTVVNRVPAEEMLKGLVPAEIYPTAPETTLRAQAITARGELLAKLGTRHLADPYLVCATQHCQVYSGRGREKPQTTLAVEKTRGKMLFDKGGRLVDSVYSASCGGHTEHNEHVWEGSAKPTLRGRHDGGGTKSSWKRAEIPTEHELRAFLLNPPKTWCGVSTKGTKVFRWQRSYPDEELDRLVNGHHPIGHVTGVAVLSRGASGRVRRVQFTGAKGQVVVAGELKVRRLLGNLRSGMFVVDRLQGAEWTFTGGGWGHGVGMCQQGAIGMGEAGKSASQILQHYYTGSAIQKVY